MVGIVLVTLYTTILFLVWEVSSSRCIGLPHREGCKTTHYKFGHAGTALAPKSGISFIQTKREAIPKAYYSPSNDIMMTDMFDFWNSFRDPDNGLYCDAIYFTDSHACGVQNNFYSLAATGMGLVMDSIFSELGLLSNSVAKNRSLTTINSIVSLWPRCNDTAFFANFTNRKGDHASQYSTIDTAIATLGALFAGRYFHADVELAAQHFARIPQWSAVIKKTQPSTDVPTGYVPAACLEDITWGKNVGKNQQWYQSKFEKKMRLITGVSLWAGAFEDFQRMYKCLGMNPDSCTGLDFPTNCSYPPCNICLDSSMYLLANADGVLTQGILKPFNEYFLVSYLAKMESVADNRTDAGALQDAKRYFDIFFGRKTEPKGDGEFPVLKTYEGRTLLGDAPGQSLGSSFQVQFAYFLTKGFQANPFYADLFAESMKADMKFWKLALNHSTKQIYGPVWGLGAGSAPSGYRVNSPTSDPDLVFSVPIMAGFLKADKTYTPLLQNQLRDMYYQDICTYVKTLPDGKNVKVLWRCSIERQEWRATRAEGIDFSTMVLGFSQQYLPKDFFETYAA